MEETRINERKGIRFGIRHENITEVLTVINQLQNETCEQIKMQLVAACDGLGIVIFRLEMNDLEMSEFSKILKNKFQRRLIFHSGNWFEID